MGLEASPGGVEDSMEMHQTITVQTLTYDSQFRNQFALTHLFGLREITEVAEGHPQKQGVNAKCSCGIRAQILSPACANPEPQGQISAISYSSLITSD